MFRLSSLVAVLLLLLAACQTEPAPEPEPQSVALRDHALLSTLAIAPDGTLSIADEVAASTILGESWPAAKRDLERLNRDIRAGLTPPFKSQDELFAGHRLAGWEEAGVTYTAAEVDPRNPHCKKGTCSAYFGNTCCCDWWWVVCFKSGCPCTP
jgi:hypothetical protein